MKGVLLAAMATLACVCERAAALEPGDQAPSLGHVTWLKGDPKPQFEAGHIYVLDFWATWCGPCIQSIPHLNSLAKEYADQNVHVIGIAVWPRRGQTPTRSFIARRTDLIYDIAEDDRRGTTAQQYLTSSGIMSLPHAMIVDREGKIAWIGHPMNRMDKALSRIVAGEYDIKQAQREKAAELEKLQRAQEISQELTAAREANDLEKQLELSDELVRLDPELFATIGIFHYYLLVVEAKDRDRARSYGNELTSTIFKDVPRGLAALAWQIVEHDKIPDDARDLELARQAASRSAEMTESSDPVALDALARVHFALGEYEDAIEIQEKAVELQNADRFRDGAVERLEEYRQALAGRDETPDSE